MKIVSSDQFLTAILAALAMSDGTKEFLITTDLDEKIEAAYLELEASEQELDLVCDFSFRRNQYHGDSTCFRDALYEAGSREMIRICGTTYRSFEISMPDDVAIRILESSPVPEGLLRKVAAEIFGRQPREIAGSLHA